MVHVHRKKYNVTAIVLKIGKKAVSKLFLPGMNVLSDAEYKAAMESKAFKSEIDCGNMMIGGVYESETSDAAGAENIKEKAAQLAKEIFTMKVPDAKETVSEITDIYVLREVAKNDPRKGVQEAVETRLKQLDTQEFSDLTPESKGAPEGDGSDFSGKIAGTKEELEGKAPKTAIPALKEERF